MPIRFACPSCNSVLATPERAAGQKGPCPRCGQRLQVPRPTRGTVLGKLLPCGRPSLPRPRTRRAPQAPAPGAPEDVRRVEQAGPSEPEPSKEEPSKEEPPKEDLPAADPAPDPDPLASLGFGPPLSPSRRPPSRQPAKRGRASWRFASLSALILCLTQFPLRWIGFWRGERPTGRGGGGPGP